MIIRNLIVLVEILEFIYIIIVIIMYMEEGIFKEC